MNEGTRPVLRPWSAGDPARAEAFRGTGWPPEGVAERRPSPVPELQASDLVVEMARTALDDLAVAPGDGGSGAAGAAADAAPPPEPPPPAAAPAPPEEAYRDMSAPLDTGPLMALHGGNFVRRAYLELLGREPDGRASFYDAALAEGRMSKGEILAGIRFSGEGKAVGRAVPGLRPRFLLGRAHRLPVVGRLARIAAAVAGLPGAIALLRRLEQTVAAQAVDRGPSAEEQARARESVEAHAALQARAEAQAEAHAALRAKLGALETALSGLPDARALVAEAADAAARHAAERGKLTDDAVVSLADRLEALEDAVARAAHRLESLPAAGPAEPSGAADPSLDALYVAFEDRFRGAREDIKGRQAVYLPLLAECGAGTLARPVVDVGCGRGEWLELLRDRDLVARGVDLNAAMVEACRGLGLDATFGDAVEHLRTAPPGSLGAVTGFHIIEHLPFKVFVQLLDAALRALAPGGAVVFETPNPDNLLVGSRNFYLDPTHRNPLPKEMTVMIAEARGFSRAHARPLHPMGTSFGAEDERLGEQLDGLFHGPQDYALVAWKP